MFTFPITEYSSNNKTYIKSVQHLQIVVTAGNTSQAQTINAVNMSYSTTLLNGFILSGTPSIDYKSQTPRIEFTNSTTVTAFIDTAGATNLTAYVCVIEFYPAAIVSIQRGTTAYIASDSSKVVAISSVTTARSALFWNGFTTNGGAVPSTNSWRCAITSSTQITWNLNTAANSGTLSWCVVEFNSAIINSVQQVSVTSTSAATNSNATISSVTTANCLSLWNGMTTATATANPSITFHLGTLQSATVFSFRRVNAADTASRTMNGVIIEFKTAAVKSTIIHLINMGSGTSSSSTTIPAVNKNYAFTAYCGSSSQLTSGININAGLGGAFLNTTTSETSIRGATASTTATLSWEVIELN